MRDSWEDEFLNCVNIPWRQENLALSILKLYFIDSFHCKNVYNLSDGNNVFLSISHRKSSDFFFIK